MGPKLGSQDESWFTIRGDRVNIAVTVWRSSQGTGPLRTTDCTGNFTGTVLDSYLRITCILLPRVVVTTVTVYILSLPLLVSKSR